MLCIVARRTRYCDQYWQPRMYEIPMTAFATSVNEAGCLEIGNKFPDLWRHLFNAPFHVA